MSNSTRDLMWLFSDSTADDQLALVVADKLDDDGRYVESGLLRDRSLPVAVLGCVIWLVPMTLWAWGEASCRKPKTRQTVGDWLRWMRRLMIRAQQRHNGKYRLAQYHDLAQEWAQLSCEYQALHGARKSVDWYRTFAANVNVSINVLSRMQRLLPLGTHLDELLPV